MTDLDRLDTLAAAATPGPWEFSQAREYRTYGGYRTSGWYIENGHVCVVRANAQSEDADGAYIAAVSPEVVQSLVARVRATEAALRALTDFVEAKHQTNLTALYLVMKARAALATAQGGES